MVGDPSSQLESGTSTQVQTPGAAAMAGVLLAASGVASSGAASCSARPIEGAPPQAKAPQSVTKTNTLRESIMSVRRPTRALTSRIVTCLLPLKGPIPRRRVGDMHSRGGDVPR